MATGKKGVVAPVPSEQELLDAARDVVREASGLSASEFKKVLGTHLKRYEKDVVLAAEKLAAQGEFYRWSAARKVRFFKADPLEILPRAVHEALSQGQISEAELMQRLDAKQRGLSDLAKEWLRQAVRKDEVFQVPGPSGSRTKLYSLEPNIATLLKGVLTALNKVVKSPVGQKVPLERFVEVIAQSLGAGAGVKATIAPNPREVLLEALQGFAHENPKGALLSVREFRTRVQLPRHDFDATALELMKDGLVTLHRHDFPSSLSEDERSQLIADRHGTHYVGIALSRNP